MIEALMLVGCMILSVVFYKQAKNIMDKVFK